MNVYRDHLNVFVVILCFVADDT